VASDATFTVTNHEAPRLAVQHDIRDLAEQIAAEAAADTPIETGRLAAGYHVEQGDDPATSIITNDVPYARFVEYGTKYMPAQPALGRAVARHR
jgi:HK97 gp10 family phage protein